MTGEAARPAVWRRAEAWISVAALVAATAMPLVEIAGRKAIGRGIPGSIPIVQHLTLWIAFLGAALAASSNRLLALSTGEFLPERWRGRVRVFTSAIAAGISGCLLLAALDLMRVEREAEETVAWGIPAWAAITIMPLGFGAVAARLIWHSSGGWRGRLAALAGLALPAVALLFPQLQAPPFVWPLSILILIATALGMPIFAALGGAALLCFWREGVPGSAVTGEVYRLAASPMLPAIPLFTFGGYIFSEGGASKRLMRTLSALVGWMPGGLAIVTTLVLAFFTPFTGASGVTILSMGGLLLPVMVRAKYPEQTSVGLVTVSGSIGLLFPPSLPVILYAIAAQTPIPDMFRAGLLPGVLLVAVVASWGAWKGWRSGAERTRFQLRGAASAVWEAKWELLLPVVILGGLFGGFTTLVESAALTVLYALAVECFVYRDLSFRRDLPRIALECSTMVGAFLIILGVALGFTNYLVHAEVPAMALDWVRAHIHSRIVFLLALNVLLLIAGALMDIYSAILVVVPLILPIAAAYSVTPVHLGLIFLANMELGYLTPPMGENLFLSSYRFKQPLMRIYASTLPYCVMLLVAVLLITYVPGLGGG